MIFLSAIGTQKEIGEMNIFKKKKENAFIEHTHYYDDE